MIKRKLPDIDYSKISPRNTAYFNVLFNGYFRKTTIEKRLEILTEIMQNVPDFPTYLKTGHVGVYRNWLADGLLEMVFAMRSPRRQGSEVGGDKRYYKRFDLFGQAKATTAEENFNAYCEQYYSHEIVKRIAHAAVFNTVTGMNQLLDCFFKPSFRSNFLN